jgi:hypothetical protein
LTAADSPDDSPDELTVRHQEAIAKTEEARARRAEGRFRALATVRYNIILAVVVLITLGCLVGMVAMGLLIPDPTPSQVKLQDGLQQGFTAGLGGLIGLLVGKVA